MDFLFRGDDPDEKIDEVFGRDPKFDPADYEDEIPEFLSEYMDNHYDYPMDEDDGEGGGGVFDGGVSFPEILEHCIEPTVKSALAVVGKLIVWCIIFRVTTQSARVPRWLAHGISATTGLVALSLFFRGSVVYLAALALLTYSAISAAHAALGSHRGAAASVVSVVANVACEVWLASATDWHQIRGAQMILTMKAISLGFDMDRAHEEKASEAAASPKEEDTPADESGSNKSRKPNRKSSRNRGRSTSSSGPESPETPTNAVDLTALPNILEYFGYTLCPGNSVFGPWVTYEEYHRIFSDPVWNPVWLVKIVLSLFYSLVFFTISTCFCQWMIPDGISKWGVAYRDAMSFRASHYFVSYVSEATVVAAGIGATAEGRWTLQVSIPLHVEMPRSLTEVVKAWNIPMHNWLKKYCFKQANSRFGSAAAVTLTYLASTMLHGLNFQLAAVLLSLGFYTYVEHSLRRKLAAAFDASITATKPYDPHAYRHKEGEFLVMLANMVFGILTMFHLAYLGVMFNQDVKMTEGYSWQHTLAKWRELGFSSTWIMGGLFIVNSLL